MTDLVCIDGACDGLRVSSAGLRLGQRIELTTPEEIPPYRSGLPEAPIHVRTHVYEVRQMVIHGDRIRFLAEPDKRLAQILTRLISQYPDPMNP